MPSTAVREVVELAACATDQAAGRLVELLRAAPPDLEAHLAWVVAADVDWPIEVYRAAGPTIQRRIVERIEGGGDRLLCHRLLLVLAQTRGPVAESAFRSWRDDPPRAARGLGRSPSSYTFEGGWVIEGGGSRELCGAVAYNLVLAGATPPAPCRCPWCGSRLWMVINMDAADPRVAEAVAHAGWIGKLRVTTCHFCSCYGITFADVTTDGGTRWSEHNVRPGYIGEDAGPEEPPDLRWMVADRRPNPFPAPHTYRGRSRLGGMPHWEQSAAYPNCPVCRASMAYVGQVDGSDLDEYGEGMYYVFLDAACGIAAVVYQQT